VSSFGEELRRERELRQITLREISEATKISLRYLDALERNDFRHLPGGVFNKGFVRAYSQYIGVDPESMVNAYLLEAKEQHPGGGEGLSREVFRPEAGATTRASGAGPPIRRGIGPLAIAGALFVAVAASALVWWWWWGSRMDDSPSKLTEPAHDSSAPSESRRESSAGLGVSAAGETPSPLPEDAPVEKLPEAVAAAPEPEPEAPSTAGTTSAAGEEVAWEIRVVLRRPTQGRLNCDNRRVEILDGMSEGTELVFTCRDFLLVDALDGGALLVQRGRAEAASLAPDGVPVLSRKLLPPGSPAGGEEPS